MTADTYGSIIGLIVQGTGNNNNSWGTTFNNSFASPTERAIGGINTITRTSGTEDLSATVPPAGLRADVDYIQLLNGALVGDVTVQVPNVSKTWWFQNNTTNAYFVYVKTPSGTAIQIPQGCGRMVMCDGANNLIRHDKDEIGSIRISAKAAIGSGELAPNGASLLKTAYPDLYAKIGTTWGSVDGLHFTLPNFTDTGRFLRSSSGSLSVGTYQSNQNAAHTHTASSSSVTGTTDSQGSHTHTATPTDPGHVHGLYFPNGGGGASWYAGTALTGQVQDVSASVSSKSATTGISVSIGASGAHTHNVTGTAAAQTIASQGGTEARPEAAVVLFGIRY